MPPTMTTPEEQDRPVETIEDVRALLTPRPNATFYFDIRGAGHGGTIQVGYGRTECEVRQYKGKDRTSEFFDQDGATARFLELVEEMLNESL